MDRNTERIKPYEGSEPYLFVSYAHRDYDRVYPILRELAARGYRFWYDEGIDPGTEWPESIARHLENSSVCLTFLSAHSAASKNCRREINFALSRNIPLLTVFLEDTKVSPGLEMQISTYQSIMGYRYPDLPSLMERFGSVDVTAPCRGTAGVSAAAGESAGHTASAAPKKRWAWVAIAAALVLGAGVAIALWPKDRGVPAEAPGVVLKSTEEPTEEATEEPAIQTVPPATPFPVTPVDDEERAKAEEYLQRSRWVDHLWDEIPISPNDPMPEGYRVLLYGEWGYGSLLMYGNDEGSIRFALTDDRIPNGFPISEIPGKNDPYWSVMLYIARDTIHLNIQEYSKAESFTELITDISLYARGKSESYGDFPYSLTGNTFIFEIQLPEQYTIEDIVGAGISLGTEREDYVDSYDFYID